MSAEDERDGIRAMRQELAYMRQQIALIGAMVQNLVDLATAEPDDDPDPRVHPAVRAALERADANSKPLVMLSAISALHEDDA